MTDYTISDGLRFVFAGVIGYVYLYILDPSLASDFASSAGVIGFPLILTVLGSLIYFLYRPLIYDRFIERLQMLFPWKHPNYRQFLADRYEVGFDETTRLWVEMRDKWLKDRYNSDLRNQAAGIHMCYLTALLAGIFGLISAYAGDTYIMLTFFILAGVSFLAAFLYDATYEPKECNMLRSSTNESERDELAFKLGYKLRSTRL